MVQGSTECAIEGCGGSTPRWSALCALHRDRLAAGERLTDGERLPRVCSVEGCDRGRPLRRGLCSACYARAARAGALPPRHPRVPKPRPQCAIDGCERRADGSRGMCRLHYRRVQQHGNPHHQRPKPKPLASLSRPSSKPRRDAVSAEERHACECRRAVEEREERRRLDRELGEY